MAPNAPSAKARLHTDGANQPHHRRRAAVVAGLLPA
jgi:hypothetical protein